MNDDQKALPELTAEESHRVAMLISMGARGVQDAMREGIAIGLARAQAVTPEAGEARSHGQPFCPYCGRRDAHEHTYSAQGIGPATPAQAPASVPVGVCPDLACQRDDCFINGCPHLRAATPPAASQAVAPSDERFPPVGNVEGTYMNKTPAAPPCVTGASADAKRYQHLRDHCIHIWEQPKRANTLALIAPEKPAGMKLVDATKGEVLDAAIDAAIAAASEQVA